MRYKLYFTALLFLFSAMYGCHTPTAPSIKYVAGGMTHPDSLQATLLHPNPLSDITLDTISELLNQYERNKPIPLNIDNLYRDLGWKYFNNKNYGNCYLSFERSLTMALASNDSVEEAYTRLALGELYMELNHHDRAATSFEDGLALARTLPNSELMKYAFNCIIKLEFAHKNYQLAERYAKEAIERFQNEPADMSFHFYNVLGLIDLHMLRWTEAKLKFQNALLAAQTRPEIDKGFIYGNLGSAYIGLRQLDSASYFLEQDLHWSLKRNYVISAYTAAIGLMEVYELRGVPNINEARNLLYIADSLVQAGRLTAKPEDYLIQIKLLRDLPVAERNYVLEKKLIQVSTRAREKSKDLNKELDNIQQLAEAVQNLKVTRQEAALAKKINFTLFTSAFIVLVVAFGTTIIYLNKRRKLKRNWRQLEAALEHEKKEHLNLHNYVQMKQFELSALQEQNDRLNAALQFQQSAVEQNKISNDYLISVKQKTIDRLVSLIQAQPEITSTLKHSVHMAIIELEQLEQAAIHLTPTGSDKNIPFEEQLQGLYPDLSGDEIKILTYVRMSMSTAEIARLKSITIAGVNKSRNRIRKKLGLQPFEDLREHLFKL